MLEDQTEPPLPTPDCTGVTGSAKPPLPIITSEDLLLGGREIQIRHGAEVYVLRLTRNGKLILTK